MIESIELVPGYFISRVIKGGWHLAGGHGAIDKAKSVDDMLSFVKAGITTFDCADIYTGVEGLIGEFLQKHKDAFSNGSLPPVQIHTKYVPDYQALGSLNKVQTESIIDRSLSRLGVERLDLVQFAWWDYNVPGYVETALHLSELQAAGKIRYIGVTNFDASHLNEIIDAGVSVVSNQVQYSLLDRRPEFEENYLVELPLLCYGVIAGGFISDAYLGLPKPSSPLENRSLVKYALIIEECGGWNNFQDLLTLLKSVGQEEGLSISEVAMAYMLARDRVASIIVGARNTNHLDSFKNLSSIRLSKGALACINEYLHQLPGPQGPVYDLERDKDGKHGRIMKYNLNEQG